MISIQKKLKITLSYEKLNKHGYWYFVYIKIKHSILQYH